MGGKGFSLCGGGCGLVKTSVMGDSTCVGCTSPGNGGTGGIKLLNSEGLPGEDPGNEASVRCIKQSTHYRIQTT